MPCHPLIYHGRILGTLSFGTCNSAHFTDDELDLMQAVTDLVATAMARKNVEDTLRGTSQYLENLIDYANAPIIVWDRDLRIQRFNHAFEFLTGMSCRFGRREILSISSSRKNPAANPWN